MIAHGGQALTSMPVDSLLRIVHIEDEPETVYAQLTALGLHPGSEIRLMDLSPTRLRIWVGGEDHLLAPIIAANISVLPIEDEPAVIEQPGESLTNLKPGEIGEVVTLSPAIRGVERRRFMDLGILPGTKIRVEMTSPVGDPTAYRIRDAVIALRSAQAKSILVSRLQEVEA
jgi:DtxR family Mn-dependent transcriptional regulator